MKHAKRILVFMAVSVALFVYSCKKDQPASVDLGYRYFPNNVGHYVIYEVDSTVYDPFTHDTVESRYQVKEVVESIFQDNLNRPTMRIERYKRNYNPNIPYDSLPWVLADVWSANRTTTGAERFEENQRFLRLVFPAKKDVTWNGNEYNTIGEWKYKYDDVDFPCTINNVHFDSTLLVTQIADTANRLNYRYYRERYALGVGLIEKTVTDVYDTAVDFFHPVTDRIYGGTKYSIKYVSHGN